MSYLATAKTRRGQRFESAERQHAPAGPALRARLRLVLSGSVVALAVLAGWSMRKTAPLRVEGATPAAAVSALSLAARRESRSTAAPPAGTGWSATGVVVDRLARPIAEASVCAVDSRAECCSVQHCTVTDQAGRFGLTAAQEPLALLAAARGFASRRHELAESAPSVAAGDTTIVLGQAELTGVTGSVLDATGGPIAGALVTARAASEGPAPSALAVSDDDGAFRLDVAAGPTELTARAEAYSIFVRRVAAPADSVRLVLLPSSHVAGRVSAAGSEEPIAGAQITAVNTNGAHLPVVAATSGPDGSFELRGLGVGAYSISAQAEGWQQQQASLSLGSSEAAEVSLALVPAGALHAKVSLDGSPCSGASVRLEGSAILSERADTHGELRITTAPPGRYSARVHCADAAPYREELELKAGSVEVRSWELERGLTLRGRARRANGLPLRHAPVLALPAPQPPADRAGALARAARASAPAASHCVTDEAGAFACGGLTPGQYELRIADEDQPRSSPVRVSLQHGAEPEVELLAYASGSIRVTFADPAAPRGSLIVLAKPSGGGSELQAVARGEVFVIEDVQLDRYLVHLGSSSMEGQEAHVERDGQVVQIVLPVPETCSVSGRVVDEQEMPVPDAWVRASSRDDFRGLQSRVGGTVLTDLDGSFVLSGLLDGRYELSATSQRGEAELTQVSGCSRDVPLRIRNFGGLSGTVRAPDGSLLPSFSVSYADESGDGGAVAGSAGRWSIGWLAPGPYLLEVRSEHGAARATATVPPSGESTELSLSVRPSNKLSAPGSPDAERRSNQPIEGTSP